MNRHLTGPHSASGPFASGPRKVLSLNIDHGLQPSSASMSERCSKIAQSIGVEHIAQKIPWADPPYPPCPSEGAAFEETARNARYHALFDCVKREDIGVLAFGHHGDDQVETSLMRLGRGSKATGAGGMRACRRWGMGLGKENSLGWQGSEGMKRWVIRPFLDVGKASLRNFTTLKPFVLTVPQDRILVTCEKNELEYITDATNFQPHLTLRNALRQVLANNGELSLVGL